MSEQNYMSEIAVNSGRIQSIDVLRGFALLGLLSMNIISFSMPNIVYYNPTAIMSDSSIDPIMFGMQFVLADQKFMAIFSLLFGASTLLILRRTNASYGNLAALHFKRNFWLIVFGFLHGLFLWEGDVLLIYGFSALALYFVRNIRPSVQASLGLLLFLTPAIYSLFMGWLVPYLDQSSILWLQSYWSPPTHELTKDIALYQGDYWSQLIYRFEGGAQPNITNDGKELHGLGQLIDFFCRSIGMMCLGMAAFKTGIISGHKAASFYVNLTVWGLGIGIPLSVMGLYLFYQYEFEAIYVLFIGRIPNQLATLFIAFGYVGLITLWCQTQKFAYLRFCLAAIGKMALTNYIAQTLICSYLFYGFGLGLYGQMNRLELFVIMVAIWCFQICASVVWLRFFVYGPIEWLWRSLSFLRLTQIKR